MQSDVEPRSSVRVVQFGGRDERVGRVRGRCANTVEFCQVCKPSAGLRDGGLLTLSCADKHPKELGLVVLLPDLSTFADLLYLSHASNHECMLTGDE